MKLRLTYYPDITQHRTPQQVRDAVVEFAGYLAKQLSQTTGRTIDIDVLPVVSVRDQTKMIAVGD